LDGIESNKFISIDSKYNKILQKLKVKINIIVTFNIKIHDENIHDVYVDTMKIYYSFNNLEEKNYLEEDVLVVRSKVENSFYNLFIKKMMNEKINDIEVE